MSNLSSQIQVKSDKEMVVSSFLLKASSLEAIGTPTFEDWTQCGSFLKQSNQAVHFWIGDWLNFGEHTYGEKYAQEIDETGYSYATLSQDKWVANRIASCRRLQSVPFSHHVEVADLEPDDQEKFLTQASEENLPLAQFRKIVRHYKLSLYLPEMTEEQIDQIMEKDRPDMSRVQPIVEIAITLQEILKKINLEEIDQDSRDYLLSELRKVLGRVGEIIIRYGRQKK